MVKKNLNCLFCNFDSNSWRENVYETENFKVRVGLGIITAGHCMIVPKDHYKCMGELPRNLIPEYLDLQNLLIEKISEKVSVPFMVEYGTQFQTVPHAHTHLIPSSSDKYSKVNIIKEFVLPTIEKHKIPFEKTDMYGLNEIYRKEKYYTFFEQDGEMYVLKTRDFSKEKIVDDVSYRAFFARRNIGVLHWSEMTEEQKVQDKMNIEKSKEILDFLN